ncbi:MAG: P pilus assembly/Cpx signaling pathway, periplasmic inhibitor/zinc-resistance associated protein [Nostocaceae cyanobacterium]|nr:P pilus assembly/Cpx signaling pathway, periplasmic inhibitor/zinc-resistance associated protein [Nostocaceae cyanobacterium]
MKRQWMPILAAVITVGLSATPMLVQAQDTTTPPARGEFKERMAERLNLTQAQKDQLKQIRENTRSQIDTVLTEEQRQKLQAAKQAGGRRRGVWASLNLTQEQKDQIKAIRQSAKEQMKNVLTAEQQAQLEQMMKNRRGRWQKRQSQ